MDVSFATSVCYTKLSLWISVKSNKKLAYCRTYAAAKQIMFEYICEYIDVFPPKILNKTLCFLHLLVFDRIQSLHHYSIVYAEMWNVIIIIFILFKQSLKGQQI